jgi:hypothetical protein
MQPVALDYCVVKSHSLIMSMLAVECTVMEAVAQLQRHGETVTSVTAIFVCVCA